MDCPTCAGEGGSECDRCGGHVVARYCPGHSAGPCHDCGGWGRIDRPAWCPTCTAGIGATVWLDHAQLADSRLCELAEAGLLEREECEQRECADCAGGDQ